MRGYNHKEIEPKWQKKWEEDKVYTTTEDKGKEKFYVLDMFPYPSGEGLHVGHPKGYIATDIIARFKKMRGYNVLHPMGWDAFGLPAENYAIKNKVHPRVAVEKNIERFKEQLKVIGFTYDWEREVNTTDPEYYKWTQWIFLKLYEKGLAYESHEPINWCPSCKTGLANEDLENGKCERCGSVVEQKPIRQWVLKIREYADRLLEDLEGLEWPESIKESQKNWIGRSEGADFICKVKDLDIEVKMYNSVPQTYCAETFTVIAPEHPLVKTLVEGTEYEESVMKFVEEIKQKKLADKFNSDKDLSGIFTGRYIENFCGRGIDLPIWVAGYAIYDYGTGIVNASAHDERDFAFAKANDIPLHPVMFPEDEKEARKVRNLEYAYCRDEAGVLEEPKEFEGRLWGEAREDIIDFLKKGGYVERKVNYKLRDWVFSRQRYWGEPIPIIHCGKCGAVPVPEEDLPVELPEVESYEPTGTGESPLAGIDEWVNVKCPKCGGEGKRETNTMPQWAGSSWYYLRYIDPENSEELVDKDKDKMWSPVDLYVGGAEHATRHLIYARFWHKFLYDIGVVNYKEPFSKLQHVGLINAEDGRKMSKRWGNVINPDDVVEQFGADTLRVYEMFLGPFDQTVSWSTDSIVGPRRFLEKVATLKDKVGGEESKETQTLLHQTIKKVTGDIESLDFNTAVSQMMILVNALEKEDGISKETYFILLQLLAPFAPHLSEELWADVGGKGSIHLSAWPEYDEDKVVEETVSVAVQVNGKVRATIEISSDESQEEAITKAKSDPKIKEYLEGQEIKKEIYIPGRIISFVT